MPVDGPTTRQTSSEPKSPPEAKPQGADGESGIPPTVKQPTKPFPKATTTYPASPLPPASFSPKVDAKGAGLRQQAAAEEQPLILSNRTGGQAFIAKQRREATSISVTDSVRRILNSLYTTDVFCFTDESLLEWFRKDKFVMHEMQRSAAPFFSTPSLVELMLKDKPAFKARITSTQAKIPTADGPDLEELLITLTECIVEHYQTSVPTTIKLAVYLLTNTGQISDDSLIGLSDGASKVGLTTTFIENYYQVSDADLDDFQYNECAEGVFTERGTLDGDFESAPGYQRLCADRAVFTTETTYSAYDEVWQDFWDMLKSVLCSHANFVPDIDLAQRRRIINGDPHHPLCQQYTSTGLEPDRLLLDRLRRADAAGLDFQRRLGFSCGLDLDDIGLISIGEDSMHKAMRHEFNLVLMRRGCELIKVPRIDHTGKMDRDRELPKVTWSDWKSLFCEAYKLYKAKLNKPSFKCTTPKPITSNMTLETSSESKPQDQEPKTKNCRWCHSPNHDTCDCPSDERKQAGVCRAYQRGKCRQGSRHCKYWHVKLLDGEQNLLTPNRQSTESHITDGQMPSQQIPSSETKKSSFNTDKLNNSQKSSDSAPDDFTKEANRTCVIPECSKAFHIPLEGEYGVKWYHSKGMFLPKRCTDCIKSGKRVHRPGFGQTSGSGNTQTQLCDMHDPEAVDTLLCAFEGTEPDMTHETNGTSIWCTQCGVETLFDASAHNGLWCNTCNQQLEVPTSTGLEEPLTIVPPPTGNASMMIELSDASTESTALDSTSEDDSACDSPIQITAHSVRIALLEQWSGLELHPAAFVIACETIEQFLVDGVPDSSSACGTCSWDGNRIDPTGPTVSIIFKRICKAAQAHGLTSDQIEMAYGVGVALETLTTNCTGFFNSSATDTGADENQDILGSDTDSTDTEDPSVFFTRIYDEYLQLTRLAENSIANNRPKRAATGPIRYEPSPTGVRREIVSPQEYYAAVIDPVLSDAVINSDSGSNSTCGELADELSDVLCERNFR